MNVINCGTTADIPALKALFARCFPDDSPDFWDWMLRTFCKPEDVLVYREQGDILSAVAVLPCEMQEGDRRYPAHYIYAASTAPEARGRGLMGRLLRQAHAAGAARGEQFSVLITQEDSLFAYYDRFGYESRLLAADKPVTPVPLPQDAAVRTLRAADIPALRRMYEQDTASLLCGRREDGFWALQLELFGQDALLLERGGVPTAYLFADERGILEVGGGDALLLAGVAAERYGAKSCRTVPQAGDAPMGCIKPLTEEARRVMEQHVCYLNLMYN